MLLLASGYGLAAQVSDERLLRARDEPQNWLTYSGAYDGWRYSPLRRIDTGNVKRDKDLRGARFLDTAQFPDVTFECTEIRTSADGWRLAGTLEAHGTTIPVTVEAEPTSGPANGSLSVHATAKFDRRALGIKAPRLMIGREIVVEISCDFRASGGQTRT